MAWIELHQSLPTHYKTIECAAMLNISVPQMIGHLCCFWLWALDNSKDGVLSQLCNATIALASQWQGDPDEFVNALIASNFIEKYGENLVIHDWYDYAGRLMEQRKANRERQRRHRKKEVGDNDDNRDVTVTSRLCHDTSYCDVTEHRTVPNQTLPDQNNKDTHTQACAGESADEFSKKAMRTKFVTKLFDEYFWPLYPRKKAKQDALKAFKAIFPITISKDRCEKRWRNIVLHVEALKAEGRPLDKIPYPATFLRAEDFDEPPAQTATDSEQQYEWVEVDNEDDRVAR